MNCKTPFLALLMIVVASLTFAQEETVGQQSVSSVSEIKSLIESYVDAFNAGDVAKLSSFWSAEGVFVDQATSEQVTGRDAIETSFRETFAAEPGVKLACQTRSIEVTSPSVVIEDGICVVTHSDGDLTSSRYRVVYVKRDGKWSIDRVTDNVAAPEEGSSVAESPSRLQELGWMIGQWVDRGEDSTIEISCDWAQGESFLTRKYSVTVGDEVETSGLQLIGWDAHDKTIRSWLFDQNGAVLQGEWTQRGDAWQIRSIATLADGARGSSTTILTPVDEASYRVEKVERVIDGQILPNLEPVFVTKVLF